MRGILPLLIVALATPAAAFAQTAVTVYTFTGTVRLPDGSPASRVTLRITSQSGYDRMAFTDDMGRFELRDMPRGRYYITATNPADPSHYTDPVEADTVRSFGGRLLINVFLRRKVDETTSKERKPVVSVAEASQNLPKGAQKAFEQALRSRSNRDNSKALERFNRAIEIYPRYFQALAERGHLRIAMGRVAEAAEDFARALELDDRYEPALRGSGICRFQQGRFAEASADLERAIAIDATHATSFLFLGIAQLSLDRREPARKALEKSLALDAAGSARAHVYLANLHLKDGRLKEAAAELDTYLTAVPNAPDADKLRATEAAIRARIARP